MNLTILIRAYGVDVALPYYAAAADALSRLKTEVDCCIAQDHTHPYGTTDIVLLVAQRATTAMHTMQIDPLTGADNAIRTVALYALLAAVGAEPLDFSVTLLSVLRRHADDMEPSSLSAALGRGEELISELITSYIMAA